MHNAFVHGAHLVSDFLGFATGWVRWDDSDEGIPNLKVKAVVVGVVSGVSWFCDGRWMLGTEPADGDEDHTTRGRIMIQLSGMFFFFFFSFFGLFFLLTCPPQVHHHFCNDDAVHFSPLQRREQGLRVTSRRKVASASCLPPVCFFSSRFFVISTYDYL